jgi:hypothetical protein
MFTSIERDTNMSNDKRFGGRRRRGMRFKPSGGLANQPAKKDKAAVEARAEAIGEVVGGHGQEKLFERRHQHEIERAENVAAGLPPEGAPEPAPGHEHQHPAPAPQPAAPAAPEKPFAPVKVPEPSRSLVEKITDVAASLVKKVQRLIRPEKKIHKEVIINAETLETRVAVTEDGKLEEFNIERTTEERLVGSIFKGKVRNLEDGLKAAFVDIGFEKNAFLHYWDIVPNQFDSGVEIVDRPNKKRDRPKDHAKGHSASLSARLGNHRAGHQRSHRHERSAHHHEPRVARSLSRVVAQLGSVRHLPQD